MIDLTNIGHYKVILADPPWLYDIPAIVANTKSDYDQMSPDDIKAIRVPKSKDSVLFLWAPAPKLREGLEVMDAWGYEYRTCAVWEKPRKFNQGFYFMVNHELLLVGKAGNMKCPRQEDRAWSVFSGKSNHHSQKPDSLYTIIEKMYPDQSKIELFARRRREGWDAWGNQLNDTVQMTLKKALIEG
jgi:N6-adenosine-specific RNA methylase IME4